MLINICYRTYSWLFGILTFKECITWQRVYGAKGESVFLAKPIAFGTTKRRILCWSIITIESISEFSLFLGYWSLRNGLRDHKIKGNFVSFAKPIVFGTAGKKALCRLTFSWIEIAILTPRALKLLNFVNSTWFLWILKCVLT